MVYFDNELLIIDKKLAASLFEENEGFSKLKRLTKEINDAIKGNKSFIEAVGKDIAENVTFSIDVLTETTSEGYYCDIFRIFIPHTYFCIDYESESYKIGEAPNYKLFDTGKKIIKIVSYARSKYTMTNAMTLMNHCSSPINKNSKPLEEICLEALAEFVYREI